MPTSRLVVVDTDGEDSIASGGDRRAAVRLMAALALVAIVGSVLSATGTSGNAPAIVSRPIVTVVTISSDSPGAVHADIAGSQEPTPLLETTATIPRRAVR